MDHHKQIFALGFFDGVHLGHQALLAECVRLAREMDAQTAAITFKSHPQSLFRVDPPPLIGTLQDRYRLLRRYGIHHIYAFPVTKEVMGKHWKDFLLELMEFGAAGFVCGHDFRFGSRGEGNAELLREFCRERKLPCIVVPEQSLNGVRISSSYIRKQIGEGDMATAVRYLGHGHMLTGTVVTGRKLGHKLGFPTANIELPEGVIVPRHGVYACYAYVGRERYMAVCNVGNRPTVEGHQVRTETWLLDFSGDLYGQNVTLEFLYFLRPERRFESVDVLKEAVLHDAEMTRNFFANS
ncbi:MAG: bifunctional riboflavin kinase/FAD synthetase [Oscillospiraceae bacterium]|nr:bifunctional riboflavin kinase/FAD synthetase [Oscillospiraceae bacterium]